MSTAPSESIVLNEVTVERAEGGQFHLHIEVAPTTVQAAREQAMLDYSRRLKVPGFRPGRIPANIVRRNVGDEAIAQKVSDELVPAAYRKALEQEDLHPLTRAEIDQLTFDAFNGEEPLKFTAHVIMRPEVTLGTLEGLKASRAKVEVTPEDLEGGLDGLRNEHAILANVEGRGAQEGDVLNAELQVYLDGNPRSEEPAKLRAFILGKSGFVPSIDEHLTGAELDEVRRFDVTYPSDYNDADLAGQVAEFEVKVTSIKERILPALDEEFAKQLGMETIEEVRERMQRIIEEDRQRAAQTAVRNQIVQTVSDEAVLEVPHELVHQRVHTRIHGLEHELQERDLTMEQYLADVGKTSDELHDSLMEELGAELRRELVLDAIARREDLRVTGEEIENHYRMMSNMLQRSIEELIQQIDVNTVQASLLQRKAVDWLLERAEITDEE